VRGRAAARGARAARGLDCCGWGQGTSAFA